MELPDEILWEIMLFLNLNDIYSCIITNKQFYEVIKNDNFWKDLYYIYFKPFYRRNGIKNYKDKIKDYETFNINIRNRSHLNPSPKKIRFYPIIEKKEGSKLLKRNTLCKIMLCKIMLCKIMLYIF